MRQYIAKVVTWCLSVTSLVFAVVPEDMIAQIPVCCFGSYGVRIFVTRVLMFLLILSLTAGAYALYFKLRISVTIKSDNCEVLVKYGDLFEERGCRRVIAFDECFTTSVGQAPEDIRPNSICGQYLNAHPDLDIEELIKVAKLDPEPVPSKYDNRKRYALGSVVENGGDLLLAFAPLSKFGRAEFSSRDEYLGCLSRLWDEAYLRHGGNDVCIPILGSGAAEFSGGFGRPASQQELLDMILRSYFLSYHKIKSRQKLRIVCRRQKGFSLNKIGLV